MCQIKRFGENVLNLINSKLGFQIIAPDQLLLFVEVDNSGTYIEELLIVRISQQ